MSVSAEDLESFIGSGADAYPPKPQLVLDSHPDRMWTPPVRDARSGNGDSNGSSRHDQNGKGNSSAAKSGNGNGSGLRQDGSQGQLLVASMVSVAEYGRVMQSEWLPCQRHKNAC